MVNAVIPHAETKRDKYVSYELVLNTIDSVLFSSLFGIVEFYDAQRFITAFTH